MEVHPLDSAASIVATKPRASPTGDNNRDDAIANTATEILRRVVIQQSFVAKPTAYAPYGSRDQHPLHDAHAQLQARLQALRDVRKRLRFVPSSSHATRSHRSLSCDNNNEDVDMTDVGVMWQSSSRDSMEITTRVALSTPVAADNWVQEGGIMALGGLESLFFGFFTAHELVTASAVCQSWCFMARRDDFWESMLMTPVEKYPMREFLGFSNTQIPAIQVYIIYRKMRSQLQQLREDEDEAPRQSVEATRTEDAMRRLRTAANNNNTNNNNPPEDQAAASRPRRQPRLRVRRQSTGTTSASTSERLRSVHLVFNREDELSVGEEELPDDAELHEHETPTRRANEPRRRDRDAAVEYDAEDAFSDAEDDGVGADVVDMPDADTSSLRPGPSKWVYEGFQRVRLSTWLGTTQRMSTAMFRVFAHQLLLALASLEISQYTHSDVCMGNVLVLTSTSTHPPTTRNVQASAKSVPLFQLYCRRKVNVWPVRDPQAARATGAEQVAGDQGRDNRLNAEIAVLRARNRHIMTLMNRRRNNRERDPTEIEGDPLEMHALALDELGGAFPPQTTPPSSATLLNMVRSYVQLLRDVWTLGRAHTSTERALPFLSFMFLHPDFVKSESLRSFIEYAEYLISCNEATPTRLLDHIFIQQQVSTSPRIRLVPRSPLRLATFGSAEEYTNNAISWHARYLNTRPRRPITSIAQVSPKTVPGTPLGPAFFHDALNELRLPLQRFVSVMVPETATSSWVHTLMVTQRATLHQLDLSNVKLPLSILLRELHYLHRLTHLRLPHAFLREDNLEQFVASVWCAGLLPTLQVMDIDVKRAMDRLEHAYTEQLNIMDAVRSPSSSTLKHSFSSPV